MIRALILSLLIVTGAHAQTAGEAAAADLATLQNQPDRTMPSQDLINLIAGIGFSALGWFARVLWVSVRDLEKDVSKLREEMPRTYLPKSEAHEAINDLAHEMRENFARLFTLLDKKADK